VSDLGVSLAIDENEELGVYASASSVFPVGPAFSSGMQLNAPHSGAVAVGYGTVNIGGAFYVYTVPTVQWFTIYPQESMEINVLEDFDIKFEAKKTKTVRGIVIERGRGKFITAFSNEMNDDVEVD